MVTPTTPPHSHVAPGTQKHQRSSVKRKSGLLMTSTPNTCTPQAHPQATQPTLHAHADTCGSRGHDQRHWEGL
ncbi:hypothetical protein E2C01_038010 [Portunus trituberculatus]|uniref:Uncharacterized protein n=1 Tax=Portunus trituberculatus TaxID=210409 RepID=A0A5B7FHD8_PORTR|nr:hypothetical protein [Portunus trituberculatus]